MGKPLGGKQDFSHEISSRNGEDVDCLMSCKKTLWKLGEENVDGHLILAQNCSCKPSNGIRYCQCRPIDNIAIYDRSGSNVSRMRTDSPATSTSTTATGTVSKVQILRSSGDMREIVPLIANKKRNNELLTNEIQNGGKSDVEDDDDSESPQLSDGLKSPVGSPTRRSRIVAPNSSPSSSSITVPMHQNSVDLDTLLRCIPLAYSPRTKQLHIISVVDNDCPEDVDDNDMPPSPKESSINECSMVNNVRQLECIKEGPEMDGELQVQKKDSDFRLDAATSSESPRNTLQRIANSSASLSRTDASSFSSISSLSTNADSSLSTPPTVGVGGEELGLLTLTGRIRQCSVGSTEGDEICNGGVGCDDQQVNSIQFANSTCNFTDDNDQGAKPKRRGLTGFLTRFSWKSKDGITAINTPPNSPSSSWRLFNNKNENSTPTLVPNGRQQVISQEQFESPDDSVFIDSANQLKSSQNCVHHSSNNKGTRHVEFNPSSTTALILENRPLNLPAKPADEELRHRQQYEQMVEAVKKRELKDAKLRKRLLQRQLKHEETIVQAARMWNNEILPNWETMKSSRKARELWWSGIPPAVRGKVWKLAIGNDLNITAELYEICVNRARDRIRMASESASMSEEEPEDSSPDKESSVELIKLDVSRTFPQLCIFQKGGPYYDLLHSLLGAYVCYRPDIGYMQGMSFLAAVLILNLEVDDAFICFANLLNKPCQLAFFRLIEPMMKSYFKTYEEFFMENLPKLFHHFENQKVEPDLYLIDWIYTLYSKSLPLDVASRVWDVFFRDGEEFLFQAALGILHLYQDILLDLDFIHIAQFLTKLPDDIMASRLFQSIETIRMNIDKKHFTQVLAFHSEPTDT